VISPTHEPTEATPDDRSDEAVSVLVIFDYLHGFVFTQKAMGCKKVLASDRDFFPRPEFNVANPIRIGTKTVGDYHFRSLRTVFNNLKDSLSAKATAAANVGQE